MLSPSRPRGAYCTRNLSSALVTEVRRSPAHYAPPAIMLIGSLRYGTPRGHDKDVTVDTDSGIKLARLHEL